MKQDSIFDIIIYTLFVIIVIAILLGQCDLQAFLFIIFTVLHSIKTLKLKNALVLIVIIFILTFIFELSGTLGWIPGCYYEYTGAIGPYYFGKLPPLIPIAWFQYFYWAYIMTSLIIKNLRLKEKINNFLGNKHSKQTVFLGACITGLIMVSLDVFIDPVVVEMGIWNYKSPGFYYGIPIVNFIGWFVVSFLIYIIFSYYLSKFKVKTPFEKELYKSWFTIIAVLSYLVYMLYYIVIALDMNMKQVIIIPTTAMSFFIIISIISFLNIRKKQ